MDNSDWLEFLDLIAIEKKLKTIQKTTLKAKFPTFNGRAIDRDLIEEFDLSDTGWKKRLGGIYKIFGLPEKLDNKAIALQEYLQQEALNWQRKKEQESIDNPPNPTPIPPIQPPTPQIDWLDRSRQLLAAQKHLTTNRLLNKSNRNLDDIHVPLGLIERKERPKVKEEPSPEQGSQLYQTEYTETKRFEHEAFLAEVVGKPAGGKHIAIIGEPGAGKTTILTKIGAWLIQQAEQQPPAPLVVAWISLADVGDRRLRAYLRDEWLQKVCEDNFDAAWEDWKGLRQQGRVWLLLDGLDEMSGDALAAIHRDLGQAWAQNLRVAMTCRINQWETASNNLVNSFDVYRTLDYSYRTSQGEDQVKEFISKWFTDDPKVATQIRTELDAPGKERIKDLVKNPLRLTLLCASWEKDSQALPETQADLYRGFVNYLYKWKAAEFSDEVKLRQELDHALGKLAKEGLNRQPINDGAVRRFRFTASEISKLWADRSDTLLPTAKNLGWLNVVGEEAGEAVYAFYHPTFQEYFAACNIDDWDYFLPRAHIDRPVHCREESVPTYRVFEQEWRQVILLWMGRRDEVITDELKEKFIDKLTDFREQEGAFYCFRAYCMAAICVGEFKSSRRGEEIVQQIIKWAFGYFNTEEQEWRSYLNPISSLVRDTIPFTHSGYAIAGLISLVRNPSHLVWNLPLSWLPSEVAKALGKIAVGNLEAIANLTDLVSNPTFDDGLRKIVGGVLDQIAVGNSTAISALIELLRDANLDDELRSVVAETLGEIAVGNPKAIAALIELLDYSSHHDDRYRVAYALGQIDQGNPKAISTLIELLDYSSHHDDRYRVAYALGQIDQGNPKAISTL
jgi:NACHT domain/HEAT repeats